jgi:hypothetical protein
MRFVMFAIGATLFAQTPGFNYDESKVGSYTLPDPLRFANGAPVRDATDWRTKRRAEILRLFEREVYGKTPDRKIKLRSEVLEQSASALGGAATRRQVRLWFGGAADSPFVDLLIYLPNNAQRPVPVFLGLNFAGNHTVNSDPAIRVTKSWVRETANNHVASAKDRGSSAGRWEVEKVIARGYGTVTAYYGDIDPDFDDGFKNGVHPLFYSDGKTKPAPDEWGTIGAWAWGLSRAMDYIETDRDIDARRVALHGHSRIGKAALWAGAQDERFAIVISNNSGEGGAALARRDFGETTARINTSFPHWFAGNFKKYNGKPHEIPVDQHMLLSLIAPRPLYVNSASEDAWADPRGEFLGAVGADPVYRLLGTEGLPGKEMPGIEQPLMGRIGYHIRNGKHDVTIYDWTQWMNFADRVWKRGIAGNWNLDAGNGKVYWIGLAGDLKSGSFFGATGGRLAEMKDLTVSGDTLRFRVERTFETTPPRRTEAFVEAKLTGDRLVGTTRVGERVVKWEGGRAPELNEHDDGTWRRGNTVRVLENLPIVEDWKFDLDVMWNLSEKASTRFTREHYRNFELHAEYKLQQGGNSGIGLRNHYEVQLEDDFGKPVSLHGNGAVYSRIAPRVNASKPAGEWQTIDIRLIGREITITLNGVKTIDRATIGGIAGMATTVHEDRAGPIGLQGDHGPVEFRNVTITPLISSSLP